MAPATDDVIAALGALREEVECCSRCVLAETRTKAVFGEGDPGADLMFIGEAPGYHEDQQGRPFVGQAGKLLEQLLASIGMTREQVYIANVLKSRPPNNRDPRPEEIDACRPYLWRQIEIIRPKVICTLGNFATKLLSGDPRGITKVHGQPRATEIVGTPALPLPDLPSGRGALHAGQSGDAQRGLPAACPSSWRTPRRSPGEEAAPPPAAERPAWQPPARLQPRPTPHGRRPARGADLRTTRRRRLWTRPRPSRSRIRRRRAWCRACARRQSPRRPTQPPAATAPAPDDPPRIAAPTCADETPVVALVSDDDPAPASPSAPEAGPPAEPEQLGLF